MADVFADAGAYEAFMGRWSRLVAPRFVAWLAVGPGAAWLDVGCGTGALSAAALTTGPATLLGVDTSPGFVAAATGGVGGAARFIVGDAAALPVPDASVDVAVSGLVLNFTSNPAAVVAELVRVTRPGGVVASYVWDYAEGMSLLRHFWDAAAAVDPSAGDLDQRTHSPICHPDALVAAWSVAGLVDVAAQGLVVERTFDSPDALWAPFLGGQGSAPSYLARQAPDVVERIRVELIRRVRAAEGGTVTLPARAWAVRGRR